MLCPYCHAENKYDALTCDFCMHELPMTKTREKEIKEKNKILRKNKFKNAIIKLIGTTMGIIFFIIIVVIAWLLKK